MWKYWVSAKTGDFIAKWFQLGFSYFITMKENGLLMDLSWYNATLKNFNIALKFTKAMKFPNLIFFLKITILNITIE